MLAQHLGRKPILVPIPFGLWSALAYGAEMLPQPPITRNQVELMQIDSVASPGAPGRRPCGFHRHLCRTCSLRSWGNFAMTFGVINEVSKAPCGSTPSMLHRSGNSPSHPSEIFHRPTVAACSSRCGQAPARDPAEPDCDRSEAQISRSPEGSRVAPIALVGFPRGSPYEDDRGRLFRGFDNGVERLLCTHGSRADHQVRRDFRPPEVCCHHLSRLPATLIEGPVMVVQAGSFPARFRMA